MQRRKIIIITDGDEVALAAVQHVAKKIGGRSLSRSAGNPSPLDGPQLVQLILQAVRDPVLVMFDDNGDVGAGRGEQAIEYVLSHPQIEVLGALAVASRTHMAKGINVNCSVDNLGRIVPEAVDKHGFASAALDGRIYGDTVDILEKYQIPNVIGIGDIGKMLGRDSLRLGCPITSKAVGWILERSGFGAC